MKEVCNHLVSCVRSSHIFCFSRRTIASWEDKCWKIFALHEDVFKHWWSSHSNTVATGLIDDITTFIMENWLQWQDWILARAATVCWPWSQLSLRMLNLNLTSKVKKRCRSIGYLDDRGCGCIIWDSDSLFGLMTCCAPELSAPSAHSCKRYWSFRLCQISWLPVLSKMRRGRARTKRGRPWQVHHQQSNQHGHWHGHQWHRHQWHGQPVANVTVCDCDWL